jgi:hypothetical protein
MSRKEDLERSALRATPGQLQAMRLSKDKLIAAAAEAEIRRRELERQEMGSLTGVVHPIDET